MYYIDIQIINTHKLLAFQAVGHAFESHPNHSQNQALINLSAFFMPKKLLFCAISLYLCRSKVVEVLTSFVNNHYNLCCYDYVETRLIASLRNY